MEALTTTCTLQIRHMKEHNSQILKHRKITNSELKKKWISTRCYPLKIQINQSTHVKLLIQRTKKKYCRRPRLTFSKYYKMHSPSFLKCKGLWFPLHWPPRPHHLSKRYQNPQSKHGSQQWDSQQQPTIRSISIITQLRWNSKTRGCKRKGQILYIFQI